MMMQKESSTIKSENRGEMHIYQSEDGSIQTEVRMEEETLWLTQRKIAEMFDKDSDTIGLHLKNIFQEKELDEQATTEYFSVVQQEGTRNVQRRLKHYNLDAILSVGYRVNSKRGTQFRIWANRILKEHLVQGYTINQKRLAEQRDSISQLQETIQLMERSLFEQTKTIEEARSVVQILAQFANGLKILDDYDHEQLETQGKTKALLL